MDRAMLSFGALYAINAELSEYNAMKWRCKMWAPQSIEDVFFRRGRDVSGTQMFAAHEFR